MPKTASVVEQSSREFSGRGAGSGYSVVGICSTATSSFAISKIASANPAHDVSGAPAKW
jgi:hypothetical protein